MKVTLEEYGEILDENNIPMVGLFNLIAKNACVKLDHFKENDNDITTYQSADGRYLAVINKKYNEDDVVTNDVSYMALYDSEENYMLSWDIDDQLDRKFKLVGSKMGEGATALKNWRSDYRFSG